MTEPKKISFGFSKLTKKSNLVTQPVVEEKKVELIECLEGQSIKIKDAVEEEVKPLIISLRGDMNTLADRIKNTVNERKIKLNKKNEEIADDRPDSELTLDELAARQLLQEVRKFEVQSNAVKVHTLPIVEDNTHLEGSVEPTLEDYENIPIADYGMAMLRGMGWSENSGIGKNKRSALLHEPKLRPKGMGLGANKLVSSEKLIKPATDKNGKEISLVKGAFAKIIAGKEKGNYCVVQGLDDEAGRVIVKTTLNGNILSLNEFLLVPVTSEEYVQFSKVLNNATFNQFKEKEKISKYEKKNKERSPSLSTESGNGKTFYKDNSKGSKDSDSKTHYIISDDDDDDRNRNKQKKKYSRRSDSESDDYKHESRRRSRSQDKKYKSNKEYTKNKKSHGRNIKDSSKSRRRSRSRSNGSHTKRSCSKTNEDISKSHRKYRSGSNSSTDYKNKNKQKKAKTDREIRKKKEKKKSKKSHKNRKRSSSNESDFDDKYKKSSSKYRSNSSDSDKKYSKNR